MFNDKYGQTIAVIEGIKTQTRRIIPVDILNAVDTSCLLSFSKETLTEKEKDYNCYRTCDGDFIDVRDVAKYKIGEEVAVAQCYGNCGTWLFPFAEYGDMAGYTNKMFVRAEEMPFRIKINNIRIERLKDISEDDCLKEGIHTMTDPIGYAADCISDNDARHWWYHTPQEAYAALIDKIIGKGTWESNPWVFVYDFELV